MCGLFESTHSALSCFASEQRLFVMVTVVGDFLLVWSVWSMIIMIQLC